MKAIRRASGILCLLLAGQVSGAENVIEDEGVGMTREELEFVVGRWTPQMQKAAAVDRGDRLELLNLMMINKKKREKEVKQKSKRENQDRRDKARWWRIPSTMHVKSWDVSRRKSSGDVIGWETCSGPRC